MRSYLIEHTRSAALAAVLVGFSSLLVPAQLNAQEWTLLMDWADFMDESDSLKRFRSKKSLTEEVDSQVRMAREQGFHGASLDSLVEIEPRVFHAFLYRGPLLHIGAEDSLRSTPNTLSDLREEALDQARKAEETGYPFTSQGYQVTVSADTLSVELFGSMGNIFTLDSIVQLEDEVLENGTLSAHLRLKKGQVYKEDRLRKVDSRVKRLAFVRVIRPSELIFTQDRFRLLLAIEKKKANSANGILGFQPDENGKVRTTGEIDLNLQNALNRADRISLNWKRLQDASQKLTVSFAYPYLFKSPLGVTGSLDQFRQDSTFNQVESALGLSLLLDNGDILKVEAGKRSFLNLLEVPALLDQTDSRSTLYGVAYDHNTLDDQFNPYAGLSSILRFRYGNKSLTTSNEVQEIITEQFGSWEASADIRQYIPLFKRSTLLFRFNGYHQESEVILYKELQRIGGLFTLRGMDESVIRASSYGILSTEIRYLTDERAYVSVFTDIAYYEARTQTYNEKDTPYGIGLGTAFDTGAGVFTLNYALGSRFSQPLSFRTAKLHFGYTAFF